MRTAQTLKQWSGVVALFGVVVSWTNNESMLLRFGGIVASVTVGLLLRVLANMGQILYEWRQQSVPLLGGIARDAAQLRKSSSKQSTPHSSLAASDDQEEIDFVFDEDEERK